MKLVRITLENLRGDKKTRAEIGKFGLKLKNTIVDK